ncbi:MAG: hypothetical protein ACLPYZ_10465 [Limisphaerales bacterium]
MKRKLNPRPQESVSELLILPDGRILVHNLTQPFAELLHELNPDAEQITSRLSRRNEVKADVSRHSTPTRKSGRADLPVSLAAQQRRPTKSKAQFRNHSNIP